MYRIDYKYWHSEQVPDKWAYGEVVRYKSVPTIGEGSETGFQTEKEAKERAEILAQIVGDDHKKKYFDIKISEYDEGPIVGYSITGFSCNMFHTKEDALNYAKRHKKRMPNGMVKGDGKIVEWYIIPRRKDEVEHDLIHPVYMEECLPDIVTKEQENFLKTGKWENSEKVSVSVSNGNTELKL